MNAPTFNGSPADIGRDLPSSFTEKALAKFVAWLKERGAEVVDGTNEWELLRFWANGKVHILFRNKSGRLTWTGETGLAWRMSRTNGPWSGTERKKANGSNARLRAVVERDGGDCFYCWKDLGLRNVTLEHLVPAAHGGPSHLSNLVAAHADCNQDAGVLSAMEKIRIREANKP